MDNGKNLYKAASIPRRASFVLQSAKSAHRCNRNVNMPAAKFYSVETPVVTCNCTFYTPLTFHDIGLRVRSFFKRIFVRKTKSETSRYFDLHNRTSEDRQALIESMAWDAVQKLIDEDRMHNPAFEHDEKEETVDLAANWM